MAERKLIVYYESRSSIDEDTFLEYVHRFFCDNPDDPNVGDCPLKAMMVQDVVEEED